MKNGTFFSNISPAREKLVPIRHILRTNIFHFVKSTHKVKFHIAYMRIPRVDRIPTNHDVFAFDSNSSVLSLPYAPVQYEFFISLIIWVYTDFFHM